MKDQTSEEYPTLDSGDRPSDLAPAHFRVVMEMDIGDRPPEAFIAAWQKMAQAAAQEPAMVSQSLSVDSKQPSHFYIISEWVGEEEFRRFNHGAAHDEHVGEIRAVSRTLSLSQMHHVLTGPTAPQRNGANA